MPQSYEYDESSETWPFFLLTLLFMVLVPLTVSQASRLFFGQAVENGEENNGQRQVQKALARIDDEMMDEEMRTFRQAYQKSKKSKIWSKRNVMVVVGWALFAALVQRIRNSEAIEASAIGVFDPYALLGVTASASDRDIKSAYRKLSVKFHPDKLAKSLSSEERARIEEMYVQISKAYEALTDEITKANYLTYGHPDGPQTVSHGIAIPSFLVDRAASPVVVLAYLVLLSIVLPYLVSKWWSRTRSFTKKGIHVKTASHFVDRLVNYKPSEIVTVDLIVKWLSDAEEFKILFPQLTSADFEQLIHDHINRAENSTIKDKTVRFRVVGKCHSLLHGLLDLACGIRNTEIAIVTLETFKCIVQAVPPTPYSQIMQLPNVDKQKFLQGSVDEIHTLGKLFTYKDEEISKILGIDDEHKLKQTLAVASNIPQLKLIKAEFLVPGESQVSPSSTPHISIKLLVRSPQQKNIPPERFPESMLEEPQDFEFQQNPFNIMETEPLMPYSYAPFFPSKRRNAFCCLVALQKDAKILQTPVIVQRMSLENLTKNFDKREIKDLDTDFTPEDWKIGTIKIPLGQPAPDETGDVYFRVIIKSTDYFTTDLDFTVNMQVRDQPVQESKAKSVDYAETSETEDESSDSSEAEDEDEADDDSGSDYTDIDTDTEAEEDGANEAD
ncbi:hypothetical protein HG536_0A07990 [Torulaspora globosa]|uniref:J domain-containing protein n=1 Tax=Torulaspora globosa TaxID=48254 RepID=A0A7G3ZBU8_9SACH|nr:uncharacterized protein HG536_0A07990 [Torulaspora globosa]QLL30984.1 hypothetical protein HG536_0A07990 [Torulaspora globosa]